MSTPEKKNTRKKTSLRKQDPHLEREKLKYDNPLPSREFILSILTEQGVPMYSDELAGMLDQMTPAERVRLLSHVEPEEQAEWQAV